MVASELAAGKRVREDGEVDPEDEAQAEEDEALRVAMEQEADNLRQLKLAPKPTMEDMDVDVREGEGAPGGGQKKLIGMHDAMEMNGKALCHGYSGY